MQCCGMCMMCTLALSGAGTWSEVTVGGIPPSIRAHHVAAPFTIPVNPNDGAGTAGSGFDAIVVFGGRGEVDELADTWVLDVEGSRWYSPRMRLPPPAPRAWHSAVGCPGRVLSFGGGSGASPLSHVSLLCWASTAATDATTSA